MLKYYNELLYYAQKLVADKEKAKDIIQETYCRVLEIKNKREIKNERAYLYKIAKNVAVDEAIKNQKLQSTTYKESICFTNRIEQPDEIAITQNQEKIFLEAINKLPVRAKQAFILYTIDEYSRKEIGKIMNITSNAVEKLIKRATLKVEAELLKKGF